MDSKLTDSIQQWLALAAAERDTAAGALMLLQLNRNNFLYRRILAHPEMMASKLESELKKHLQIRLDGLTRADVAKMVKRVMPAAAESLAAKGGEPASPEFAGKRADHDDLPAEIQALYERNGEIWKKIKKTYETLKQMEASPACDRYELLKVLASLDNEYRANWEAYDHYDEEAAADADTDESGTYPSSPTAKQVIAARKFISVNRKTFEAMTDEDDPDGSKRETLRAKLQERITFLIEAGENFSADTAAALQSLGFVL